MNMRSSHKSRFWASLVLLLAFICAQPVLAEHIHLQDKSHELCELCFNHMPAAVSGPFVYIREDLAPLYIQQQAPVARDSQPERQNARGPPAPLSLS
ncbi:hypothetical protein ACNKU7_00755 [Microbulbifer sp. SA54]|uniref:hypothetical protein n=1 Tax=Microbulbifer sp. SA54 TaxID=3401577 RepID=UPI003AAC3B25